MGQPKALFFDLDDTLLDGSFNAKAVLGTCAALAAMNPALDAAELLSANSTIWPLYWPEVEHHWVLGTIDDDSVGRGAWRLTLAACGCRDEGLVQLARETHVRLSRTAFRLFDDVSEVLDELQERYALAVITNGSSETQRDKLESLGIVRRFDTIVISAEVGAAKPDAAVFQVAADRLGTHLDNCWHVGDSLGLDVAGANAAGIRSVWLNRAGASLRSDVRPQYEIQSLRELPGLLHRLAH